MNWISVKDRFPDIDKLVLAIDEDGYMEFLSMAYSARESNIEWYEKNGEKAYCAEQISYWIYIEDIVKPQKCTSDYYHEHSSEECPGYSKRWDRQ